MFVINPRPCTSLDLGIWENQKYRILILLYSFLPTLGITAIVPYSCPLSSFPFNYYSFQISQPLHNYHLIDVFKHALWCLYSHRKMVFCICFVHQVKLNTSDAEATNNLLYSHRPLFMGGMQAFYAAAELLWFSWSYITPHLSEIRDVLKILIHISPWNLEYWITCFCIQSGIYVLGISHSWLCWSFSNSLAVLFLWVIYLCAEMHIHMHNPLHKIGSWNNMW